MLKIKASTLPSCIDGAKSLIHPIHFIPFLSPIGTGDCAPWGDTFYPGRG